MINSKPAYETNTDPEPQAATRQQPPLLGQTVSSARNHNEQLRGVDTIANSTNVRGDR